MKSIMVSAATVAWTPGHALYGPSALRAGQPLVELKMLSDRRPEGGGVAYLVKFNPPAGQLIKIVAVARSEEHTYVLQGGSCSRAGRPLRFPGDYTLNPAGRPHSAFIGQETVSLVVYSGEPDEIRELAVVDRVAGR